MMAGGEVGGESRMRTDERKGEGKEGSQDENYQGGERRKPGKGESREEEKRGGTKAALAYRELTVCPALDFINIVFFNDNNYLTR